MTMTWYLAADLICLAVLIFFTALGAKRGLVLTLCSLASVIIALFLASVIADAVTPAAVDLVSPYVASRVEGKLSARFSEDTSADTSSLLEWVDELKLPAQFKKVLRDTVGKFQAGTEHAIHDVSQDMARSLTRTVIYFAVFILSFILALVAWFLISHALDLVARLPGLHFLNRTGGALLGLLKGGILIFVIIWVLRYLGIALPGQLAERTYVFRWFYTTDLLSFFP